MARIATSRNTFWLLCLAVGALGVGAHGCIRVKATVVDEPAQLEHQLLGRLDRLEHALVLASSVRALADKTPPTALSTESTPNPLSPLAEEARDAALVRAFIADELIEAKHAHQLGERRDGELELLPAQRFGVVHQRLQHLVRQENAARQIIWQRALQLSPDLTHNDLALVRTVFHRLMVATSAKGDLIQQPDGRFLPHLRQSSPGPQP